MRIEWIDEIESTHTAMQGDTGARLGCGVMLCARHQTAGRGQRGNGWEAEAGKNLLFSFRFAPQDIPARMQFALSEAFALAVCDLLRDYGMEAAVKWPNDIYVGDRKICGILIAHSLRGAEIEYSVVSAGININQQKFLSDAPNPVSLIQLTGAENDVEKAAEKLAGHISARFADFSEDNRRKTHREFMQRLYRADGLLHPFLDLKSGEKFMARIVDVAPDGLLTLEHVPSHGGKPEQHSYYFKEVAFVI